MIVFFFLCGFWHSCFQYAERTTLRLVVWICRPMHVTRPQRTSEKRGWFSLTTDFKVYSLWFCWRQFWHQLSQNYFCYPKKQWIFNGILIYSGGPGYLQVDSSDYNLTLETQKPCLENRTLVAICLSNLNLKKELFPSRSWKNGREISDIRL